MTHEKFIEILRKYEDVLEQQQMEGGTNPHLDHCLEKMIPEMREFHWDKQSDKAMRWLGFIQGVLYAHNVFTIDEMKEHNRREA